MTYIISAINSSACAAVRLYITTLEFAWETVITAHMTATVTVLPLENVSI